MSDELSMDDEQVMKDEQIDHEMIDAALLNASKNIDIFGFSVPVAMLAQTRKIFSHTVKSG